MYMFTIPIILKLKRLLKHDQRKGDKANHAMDTHHTSHTFINRAKVTRQKVPADYSVNL